LEQTARHINILRNRIKRTSLDLYAELGGAELTVSELLYLQPGDVIRLDRKSSDNIDIRIGNRVKFKGIPGKHNKHLAIKIMEVVEPGEDGDLADE
ncbi:MAG: FliM/FliN family flagellar motor switch protein, partial [Halanaerobiales bacterium]